MRRKAVSCRFSRQPPTTSKPSSILASELGDVLRRVLEVGVERHHVWPRENVESREHRRVLSVVAVEGDHAHTGIAAGERLAASRASGRALPSSTRIVSTPPGTASMTDATPCRARGGWLPRSDRNDDREPRRGHRPCAAARPASTHSRTASTTSSASSSVMAGKSGSETMREQITLGDRDSPSPHSRTSRGRTSCRCTASKCRPVPMPSSLETRHERRPLRRQHGEEVPGVDAVVCRSPRQARPGRCASSCW